MSQTVHTLHFTTAIRPKSATRTTPLPRLQSQGFQHSSEPFLHSSRWQRWMTWSEHRSFDSQSCFQKYSRHIIWGVNVDDPTLYSIVTGCRAAAAVAAAPYVVMYGVEIINYSHSRYRAAAVASSFFSGPRQLPLTLTLKQTRSVTAVFHYRL